MLNLSPTKKDRSQSERPFAEPDNLRFSPVKPCALWGNDFDSFQPQGTQSVTEEAEL
jgi:hypothetical protein